MCHVTWWAFPQAFSPPPPALPSATHSPPLSKFLFDFVKKNIFCGSQILSNWIYKIGQTKNQNASQWRCFLPANSIDDKFIKSIDVLPFCYPHDFNFSSYLEEEASSATSFMLAFRRCNNIFSIARLCTLVAIFELVNLRSFANDNDIQPAHVIKRLIDSITRFSNFDCATGQ